MVDPDTGQKSAKPPDTGQSSATTVGSKELQEKLIKDHNINLDDCETMLTTSPQDDTIVNLDHDEWTAKNLKSFPSVHDKIQKGPLDASNRAKPSSSKIIENSNVKSGHDLPRNNSNPNPKETTKNLVPNNGNSNQKPRIESRKGPIPPNKVLSQEPGCSNKKTSYSPSTNLINNNPVQRKKESNLKTQDFSIPR